MRQKTWLLTAFLLGCTAIGWACARLSSSRTLPSLATPEEIIVYDGGKLAFEKALDRDSQAAKRIVDWLAKHPFGWSPSFVTYAPVHLVKGDGYDLNFQGGRCIVNSRDPKNGKWHQLVRNAEPGESEPDVFRK